VGIGAGYLGRQVDSLRGCTVGKIHVPANVSIEARIEIDFRAPAIRNGHYRVRERGVSLRRSRGHRVFARRETLHAKLAVGIRGNGLRFGAGYGDRDVRKTVGVVAAKFVRPMALDLAKDGSAGCSFGKSFNPLNIGVVGPIGYFVRARAVSGTDLAVWPGVTVD